MAKSPDENAPGSQILRYDLGWRAINEMLRSGRSLSGHERNCCFLNLGAAGSSRFADVSSAVDADLDDDGRVLALADWDYDGDPDMWIANRSGPQLRYLRNDLSEGKNFVALRLRGTKTNRDAIGARHWSTCYDHERRRLHSGTKPSCGTRLRTHFFGELGVDWAQVQLRTLSRLPAGFDDRIHRVM